MYEHVVLFKFNDSITAAKEIELLNQLLLFKDEIPGIVDLAAGINETEETDNKHGYTLALRVTFESKQALDEYGPHPIHQRFVSSLDGIIDQVAVADYKVR